MTHKIPFDYGLYSDKNHVGNFTAYVNLSDKQIKESSDFIADGHFTGELEDLPGEVFDKIREAIFNDVGKVVRKNKIDGEIAIQPFHLSPEFIKLLPEEVFRKIDMESIFEERGVSSIEELLEKAEHEKGEWIWYEAGGKDWVMQQVVYDLGKVLETDLHPKK